jgi:sugar phosphate isomerase/epimerase
MEKSDFQSALPVGLDSYSLHPLQLDPFSVLQWAERHGADGVQFTEINLPADQIADPRFLDELASLAAEMSLYLEWGGGRHIPYSWETGQTIDLRRGNETAARQASRLGTRIIRSCSGGLMRWADKGPTTDELLDLSAAALSEQMVMLRDHDVILAIETHFEFTTFELVRLFEAIGAQPGGPIGICLDPMNLLTMLEDPAEAIQRILPWVVATHAKDGAIMFDPSGLASFTTEIGAGVIDFDQLTCELIALERPITLSVEDHGGSFTIPIHKEQFVERFPDLSSRELASLLQHALDNKTACADPRHRPLDRQQWPEQCEERVARDIIQLKKIVESVGAHERS